MNYKHGVTDYDNTENIQQNIGLDNWHDRQGRYATSQFVKHYNTERPHGGTVGKMIEPLPQDEGGAIMEFERLGGLLRSYRIVKKPLEEAA